MKTSSIKKRLRKNRPMISVTIRMPEDVIEDLKVLAPELGFSGYQPLIRYYIGQGLRKDLEEKSANKVTEMISRLKNLGVAEEILQEAANEV